MAEKGIRVRIKDVEPMRRRGLAGKTGTCVIPRPPLTYAVVTLDVPEPNRAVVALDYVEDLSEGSE